ncbi:hypothetical protein HFN89_04380 [Rhizobium laguerreae]|nr:hypothetical protein [Rhizobium laguerreae]
MSIGAGVKLLPCPFCRGAGERHEKIVQCTKCGAAGPATSKGMDDLECEEDWNRREGTDYQRWCEEFVDVLRDRIGFGYSDHDLKNALAYLRAAIASKAE